jgi:predicted nucleic acid-binding protein
MTPLLVDSNILLDIFEDDAHWADWSETTLSQHATAHPPAINPIIYAEVSVGFARIEELEAALAGCGIHMIAIPKEALFLAGKAFLTYKQRGGAKRSVLPDFFIGAHAAVSGLSLLTRDAARYQSYFPRVRLITPTTRLS